ncbi:HAD family hydrolase [Hydrogenimonas sp.]
MTIDIPGYKSLDIRYLVLDFNGTIAKDGEIAPDTLQRIRDLSALYEVHVVTADTFGSAAKALEDTQIKLEILTSSNHTEEKARYIDALGSHFCAAIGNGSNDMQMLSLAALGIAVAEAEGCSTRAILAADILCRNIDEALGLLRHPKRLTATLRR